MSIQEQLEKVQSDLQKIEERRKELQQKEKELLTNWNWKKQGLQQKRMRKSERL